MWSRRVEHGKCGNRFQVILKNEQHGTPVRAGAGKRVGRKDQSWNVQSGFQDKPNDESVNDGNMLPAVDEYDQGKGNFDQHQCIDNEVFEVGAALLLRKVLDVAQGKDKLDACKE